MAFVAIAKEELLKNLSSMGFREDRAGGERGGLKRKQLEVRPRRMKHCRWVFCSSGIAARGRSGVLCSERLQYTLPWFQFFQVHQSLTFEPGKYWQGSRSTAMSPSGRECSLRAVSLRKCMWRGIIGWCFCWSEWSLFNTWQQAVSEGRIRFCSRISSTFRWNNCVIFISSLYSSFRSPHLLQNRKLHEFHLVQAC